MENAPIKSELLRFYTVRNPKPVSTEQLESGFVQLPENVIQSSELISRLNIILAELNSSANNKLLKMKNRIQCFLETDTFIDSTKR